MQATSATPYSATSVSPGRRAQAPGPGPTLRLGRYSSTIQASNGRTSQLASGLTIRLRADVLPPEPGVEVRVGRERVLLGLDDEPAAVLVPLQDVEDLHVVDAAVTWNGERALDHREWNDMSRPARRRRCGLSRP